MKKFSWMMLLIVVGVAGVAVGVVLSPKMAPPPPPVTVEAEAEAKTEAKTEDTVIIVPKGTVITLALAPAPPPAPAPRPAPAPAPAPKPAPAPAPPLRQPVVQTNNVVSVTRNSATLAGFFDTSGEVATIWWEYGYGDKLNKRTPEFSTTIFSGGIKIEVFGLSPWTRYSYRISIRMGDGRIFHGWTRSFMTDP